MPALPRLPPAAEHVFVKRVLGMPPRLQRAIFGKPPSLDGQTLATDTHVLARLAALAGSEGFLADVSLAEARQRTRDEAYISSIQPPPPMALVEELTIPGPAGPLPARLYVPSECAGDEAAPLTVYFHGGGWVIGDLDTHDGVCRFLATVAGTKVLSVDYRLAPENPFPAAVEDALAAFLWAAANGAALGVDPARIAVGGDSAGANLAGAVCLVTHGEDGAEPAFQLLIYPPTDSADDTRSRHLFSDGFLLTKADMEAFEAAYLPPGSNADDPRVSLLKAPDLSGLPPAYLATAGFDPLRDEGEAYGERLRAAGVPVAMRRYSGLAHSFANQTGISRSARAAMFEIAGALRLGLAPPRR